MKLSFFSLGFLTDKIIVITTIEAYMYYHLTKLFPVACLAGTAIEAPSLNRHDWREQSDKLATYGRA